ncbi:MAG: hypothetical protein HY000_38030 [Planctomycetes bacterium]|nr:hypothetical protein [Planctomycetia bacterium]MBI3468839.1 hypothetical protein [Planctomycetota bacterium]
MAPTGELTQQASPIASAQSAVGRFLKQALSEVHAINVTRLFQVSQETGAWEAEVEVWQPNPTVRMLRLPTQRPVLDRHRYRVRLDRDLNILAYEESQGANSGE